MRKPNPKCKKCKTAMKLSRVSHKLWVCHKCNYTEVDENAKRKMEIESKLFNA